VPGLAAVKVALRQYALTFDGTHEDHPWGENVTKVHGKVFWPPKRELSRRAAARG